MHPDTDPSREDLVATFGQQAYYHIIYTLRRGLPALPTDDPDILRRRDHAVIARIAALRPANPAEADTAGLYVAASEQWKECLYTAQRPETSLKVAMQCRNQANAIMRQAQGALRLLLRMQAVREKRESNNRSCDRAAFTEQWNTDLMAEALAAAQPSPAATAAPSATTAAPSAPEPAPEPRPAPFAEQPITLVPRPAIPIRHKPHVPDRNHVAPSANGPSANGTAPIAANGSAFATQDQVRPSKPSGYLS